MRTSLKVRLKRKSPTLGLNQSKEIGQLHIDSYGYDLPLHELVGILSSSSSVFEVWADNHYSDEIVVLRYVITDEIHVYYMNKSTWSVKRHPRGWYNSIYSDANGKAPEGPSRKQGTKAC